MRLLAIYQFSAIVSTDFMLSGTLPKRKMQTSFFSGGVENAAITLPYAILAIYDISSCFRTKLSKARRMGFRTRVRR
jgi:hypothetical protein